MMQDSSSDKEETAVEDPQQLIQDSGSEKEENAVEGPQQLMQDSGSDKEEKAVEGPQQLMQDNGSEKEEKGLQQLMQDRDSDKEETAVEDPQQLMQDNGSEKEEKGLQQLMQDNGSDKEEKAVEGPQQLRQDSDADKEETAVEDPQQLMQDNGSEKEEKGPQQLMQDSDSDKEEKAVEGPQQLMQDSGSEKKEKAVEGPQQMMQDSSSEKAVEDSQQLSKEQEELISRIVQSQEKYESPSKDELRNVTAFPRGDSEEDSLKRFQHITEVMEIIVQLIVKFSRSIRGFDTLFIDDKIILIKGCASEVMMLRMAHKYDLKTDSIVFANTQPYTLENYRSAGMGEWADPVFHFCRNMCLLKVDNVEHALLSAIAIFSGRPCLSQRKKIREIKGFLMDTLRSYIKKNRPLEENYFSNLLSTLVKLRILGNMEKFRFSLKVQNKTLPALLEEIWIPWSSRVRRRKRAPGSLH